VNEPSRSFEPGRDFAVALDRGDALGRFRDEFHIPKRENGEDEIYFAGNSLGLLPKRTQKYVDEELAKWARLAVKAHFEGENPWMPYHELLASPMARLVGASPTEVVTMNSLTVNLHLMMASFYRPTRERHRILFEEHAFPSDDYALESQATLHGFDAAETLTRLKPDAHKGKHTIDTAEVAEVLEREGKSIALVLLPGVQYYTGQFFEIEEITRLAHANGCIVGWDLAHAAGNVVLKMHDWNVDFAVWCTYKYLNSGPGSVGGCFVHERHGYSRSHDLPRLAGWWGHDKKSRFRMEPGFRPIPGAEGWQLSNPPILSLTAIRASLDVFMEAGGIEPLREKALRLTGYLEWLLEREVGNLVEILTPKDPRQRGCQLSLRVKSSVPGRTVLEKLDAAGVTCDWREPDVIRVAPVPLYNRYEEVFRFVEILQAALSSV
jgi:kynureninase